MTNYFSGRVLWNPRLFFYTLILEILTFSPALWAQAGPGVTANLYCGLTITGTVGSGYTVQYVTNLAQTNDWQTLTNLVLASSPCLWVDTSTPESTRFYRVIVTVTTNAPPPSGMVVIPAGSFIMGDSLDGEADAPTNTEYVSTFDMDVNLVTYTFWGQIHTWAVANGYSFDNPGSGNAGNQPVQSINWYDAVKWCNARSQMDGVAPVYFTDSGLTEVYKTGDVAPYVNWSANGYRLPTETEWEKAARGGLVSKRFPLGNTIAESQANYYGDPANYSYDLGPAGYNPAFGDGIGVDTSPENYFPTNGYGLEDMAGNLAEWCWDWYGPYVSGVQTNPHGPTAGSYRVLRGGSWLISAFSCRTANRSYYYPALGGDGYGFRAVLVPAQ
jgi:formylglycine-generating enzyme required for sulfatase activity